MSGIFSTFADIKLKMELNPIKIILILLCIFNVAFGETMYHNEKLQIKGKNAQTF
jgi:hypothetical protein